MKILIVDDLEENLYLMEVMLKAKGYEVVSAKNGLEALDRLEEDSVDLIVSDILMPKMDGYGLCRKVKTDEKLREIPFIFYTATYTSKKDEEFALSLGADRFIIKPEQPEVFLEAIKELITEAEEKKLEVKKEPGMDEDTFLRSYNERLVNKLENRITKLRESNQALGKEIQERRRIEKSLKESEERYRIVADFTYDWEEWRDPEGNIIYISPSCERITGYSGKEFIDNPDLIFDILYEEDRPILEEHFKKLTLQMNGSAGITFRIIRRDGKLRWIEHRCQPVYDVDGLYLGRRISNRDITEKKKAEYSLKKSEKRFKVAFDNAAVGMTLTAPDGQLLRVNHTFADMLGYSILEMKNLNFADITYAEDLGESKQLVSSLLAGDSVKGNLTKRYIHKDGNLVWTNVDTYLHREGGEPVFFITHIQDITQRKKAENALKVSENKYRALFDNAGDGIFLMKGEHFIECNEKVLEIYGVSRDQIIGQSPVAFSPELQPGGEMSADKAREFVNQALQGNPQHFEWEHFRYDGTYFYAEVSLNRVEIEDEYLIQAIVRDITSRKETEDLLTESEHRHKMVGQLISDFAYSCVHNSEGIYEIEWITDSFYHITGFSENDLKKAHCWLFSVHPDDETIAQQQLNELKAGSKNIRIFRIQKTNGEIRWIRNHVQCIEDKYSGRLRIYGAAQDITEVREREEAIKSSLREKEVLLQEIHHRVKNNMQIISSLLSLQSHHLNEDMAKILEGSQNRVKSMALVHEKLYRSQNLSSIDMGDYVISLVTDLFYSQMVNEDQINLILEIDDIEFNIETAIPCGLIINELASNALKYAFPNGRKGELMVSLKQKADNYELIVRDDGIGLPEDLEIENVDSLGLQLVNSLINQLDGEIEVDRSRGAEFKITFRELKYTRRI